MKASELRSKAWESLVGNYWHSLLAAFLAALLGGLITNTSSLNLNFTEEITETFGNLPPVVMLGVAAVGSIVSAVSLATFVLGGIIQVGYARYLLKQQDREVNATNDLFSQFDRFGQCFLQFLLRSLYIFLWAILLVVPGIIKSFAYAMTPFIMAENPDMTAREAIKLSEKKMKGHKWELFCLNLSFIGWYLLCALTSGIGTLFLNPYTNAAYAAFYRDKIAPKVQPATYIYEEPPVME